MEPPAGFEPATTGLQGQKYKYRCFIKPWRTETSMQNVMPKKMFINAN